VQIEDRSLEPIDAYLNFLRDYSEEMRSRTVPETEVINEPGTPLDELLTGDALLDYREMIRKNEELRKEPFDDITPETSEHFFLEHRNIRLISLERSSPIQEFDGLVKLSPMD
jgi:hypothetical protein